SNPCKQRNSHAPSRPKRFACEAPRNRNGTRPESKSHSDWRITMSALLTHSARAITDGWMAFLRVLSSNYGIKFVIGENVPPATDGKTCWLPALPFELTQ